MQQLAFYYLLKGIKICGTCRKECRNLDLQSSRIVEEPDIKVEEMMEEDSDFFLLMRNEKKDAMMKIT